ncbi:hypothetical protein [Cohnella terricola]|uniref:Regulator of chromosome condensation (RCC1) repeat-containing protein n=1 Tax=Cohnella terricola TaxID=1289167 RepID=A0A559JTD9_9BACL|nr:hypothetical protein [Cohnella terricola]TVY03148.1 hypothetical protein FPZ45_04515 [Cohnella terricola]
MERLAPAELNVGSSVTAITAGYMSSSAVSDGGKLLIWGYNGYGQLGNGTQTSVYEPITIPLVGGHEQ